MIKYLFAACVMLAPVFCDDFIDEMKKKEKILVMIPQLSENEKKNPTYDLLEMLSSLQDIKNRFQGTIKAPTNIKKASNQFEDVIEDAEKTGVDTSAAHALQNLITINIDNTELSFSKKKKVEETLEYIKKVTLMTNYDIYKAFSEENKKHDKNFEDWLKDIKSLAQKHENKNNFIYCVFPEAFFQYVYRQAANDELGRFFPTSDGDDMFKKLRQLSAEHSNILIVFNMVAFDNKKPHFNNKTIVNKSFTFYKGEEISQQQKMDTKNSDIPFYYLPKNYNYLKEPKAELFEGHGYYLYEKGKNDGKNKDIQIIICADLEKYWSEGSLNSKFTFIQSASIDMPDYVNVGEDSKIVIHADIDPDKSGVFVRTDKDQKSIGKLKKVEKNIEGNILWYDLTEFRNNIQ